MSLQLKHRAIAEDQGHWIPLSDLMTGLMMTFLLISLSYMVQVEASSKQVREIAVLYERLKLELYQDLKKEFAKDLPKWGAELDPDMTVRFKEPEVLFATGKDELKPRFESILNDFFPRYIRILTEPKYRNAIKEVRIEGHTSSFWHGGVSQQQAYFLNMALSQARTRSTLNYVMGLPAIETQLAWLQKHVTANGLSSSRLVLNANGTENATRSQRVEFRVVTDAESEIAKIIKKAQL